MKEFEERSKQFLFMIKKVSNSSKKIYRLHVGFKHYRSVAEKPRLKNFPPWEIFVELYNSIDYFKNFAEQR